ncbi:PREDICTED: probable cytochrome P450 9h1 isoform X2 [Nicrophorus vespilloides]|uniref:Probable cytochrome P450 9h1 isoform X2 n=1 Tax=Nicrophorus vespilloides TaxID=110193 RepID=A0ABM1M4G3_NICVS|nr:PREDICTED: probable cytochrome P450 9h1 isoform X2 [Nicrophorus vespilloides]
MTGESCRDLRGKLSPFFTEKSRCYKTGMSFLSFELAMNNNIQDKLREEINATWKECKGNLTYKTLISMTYMDMVISEVLRKWPLFHFWTEDATRIIQFKLQNQYFGK